jgi:hypothetical protein
MKILMERASLPIGGVFKSRRIQEHMCGFSQFFTDTSTMLCLAMVFSLLSFFT